jgi:hypothetical protein
VKKKRRKLDGNGTFEYLIALAGTDENGDAWPDSREPEELYTDDVVTKFESKLNRARSLVVEVDAGPLVDLARNSVARAVCIAKTKCRPRQRCLDLPQFAAAPLAEALLEVVRQPFALPGGTGAPKRRAGAPGHLHRNGRDRGVLPLVSR